MIITEANGCFILKTRDGRHVGDFASRPAAEKHARKLGWFVS